MSAGLPEASHYAVTDLHGRLDLMQRVVNTVPGHLVFLGDLIDRGPDSLACVRLALALREQGRATLMMGNHEQMARSGLRRYREHQQSGDLNDYRRALQAFAFWSGNGGEAVRREAGGFGVERYPEELVEYLFGPLPKVAYLQGGRLHEHPPAMEGGPAALLAHASPPTPHPDYPDPDTAALWLRPTSGPFPMPHVVRYSVHGHTPLRRAAWVERHLYTDLAAYKTGRLCVVPLTDAPPPEVLVFEREGRPVRLPDFGRPLPERVLR